MNDTASFSNRISWTWKSINNILNLSCKEVSEIFNREKVRMDLTNLRPRNLLYMINISFKLWLHLKMQYLLYVDLVKKAVFLATVNMRQLSIHFVIRYLRSSLRTFLLLLAHISTGINLNS